MSSAEQDSDYQGWWILQPVALPWGQQTTWRQDKDVRNLCILDWMPPQIFQKTLGRRVNLEEEIWFERSITSTLLLKKIEELPSESKKQPSTHRTNPQKASPNEGTFLQTGLLCSFWLLGRHLHSRRRCLRTSGEDRHGRIRPVHLGFPGVFSVPGLGKWPQKRWHRWWNGSRRRWSLNDFFLWTPWLQVPHLGSFWGGSQGDCMLKITYVQ